MGARCLASDHVGDEMKCKLKQLQPKETAAAAGMALMPLLRSRIDGILKQFCNESLEGIGTGLRGCLDRGGR